MRLQQGRRFEFRMGGNDVAQLLEDTTMEMTALGNQLLQPVALLPAMQTVLYPFCLLLNLRRTSACTARTGAQPEFIRIEDGGNVIEELPEGEGPSGHLFGIGAIHFSPGCEDGIPSGGEEITQGSQLLARSQRHEGVNTAINGV